MTSPQEPGPTNYPFMDIYHTRVPFMGITRGVVFNVEQAKEAFNYANAPTVLCVDGPVCKWVECLQHAHDFFEPLTHYKCECGFEALDRPPEDGDLYLCHKCKAIPLATDHGELRKRLAEIVAGDL